MARKKPASKKTPASKTPASGTGTPVSKVKKPLSKGRKPALKGRKPTPKGGKPVPKRDKPAPKGDKSGAKSKSKNASPSLHALLMACDFYFPNRLPEGFYPNLGGCVRDVKHVEAFLRQRLGLTDDRLIRLTATDTGGAAPPEKPQQWPTYENMVDALRTLTRNAEPGDQVFLHYSGHGGRTPTCLPEIKGKNGLDEALVPIDIGNSTARYLRDVELARLLKEMTDKGLVVTVVMDCCHSGGVARAARRSETNMAIRGVDFVDSTPRPDSAIDAAELSAAWGERTAARGPEALRGLASQADALKYTLFAACRPSESAYEAVFEGTERNGALTYWLLDSLRELSPELTYRTIYNRLLARIHSQFEQQTPLLQGEADRVAFGEAALPQVSSAVVMNVDAGGKLVRLNAGAANLVRAESRFSVFPAGTEDFSQTKRQIAIVEVRKVEADACTAEVVETSGKTRIKPGDAAVLIGAPSQKLVRRVRLERADGKSPRASDGPLLAIRKALPGNGWVEEVLEPEKPADFVVRLSDDGAVYLLCDADGQPYTVRPAAGTKDPASPKLVVARLVHLAKYRAVRELDNADPGSVLQSALSVRLLGVQDDYKEGSPPKPEPFPAGRPATLKPGQWTFLSISNRSGGDLNISVLDLESNWAITTAFPRDQNLEFEPLSPGGEPLVVPLCASLPEGYTASTEILKVFATVGPSPFRTLELPPLDNPVVAKSARRGGTKTELDELVAAMSADVPPARSLVPPKRSESSAWAVAQVEVRVASDDQPAKGAALQVEDAPRTKEQAVQPPADAEMLPPPRDRKISLWQSAVEEAVASAAAGTVGGAVRGARGQRAGAAVPVTDASVRRSGPVLAASALAAALDAGSPLTDPQPGSVEGVRGDEAEAARGVAGTAWTCNKIALQLAWAKVNGDTASAARLADELSFGACDPLWADCVERYVKYFQLQGGRIPYRTLTDNVLDIALPKKGTIALLADWGTGTATAANLLRQVATHKPDLVIHLGDVYYSGTPAEVQDRFLSICRDVFGKTPVLSLSGNHDMYSGGEGYYSLVDALKQKASYFVVRNKDWQFVAVDTGFNDSNPFSVSNNVTSLVNVEAAWARGHIAGGRTAGRKTVLLSHHQLFSAFEASGKAAINRLLLDQFRPVLDAVDVWFWGHEHRLTIYDPFCGLKRGRCIGASAVPVFVEKDHYEPKFAEVPLLSNPKTGTPVRLAENGHIYHHAYALMEIDGPTASVKYFQDDGARTLLFSETL